MYIGVNIDAREIVFRIIYYINKRDCKFVAKIDKKPYRENNLC